MSFSLFSFNSKHKKHQNTTKHKQTKIHKHRTRAKPSFKTRIRLLSSKKSKQLIPKSHNLSLSIINSFYEFTNPFITYLINYNDYNSIALERSVFYNINLYDNYSLPLLESNYYLIDKSYEIQKKLENKLLTESRLKTIPANIKYATEDLTRGLSKFISLSYSNSLPLPTVSNAFIKLWEILTLFDIIPERERDIHIQDSTSYNKNILFTPHPSNVFRVFHMCEAPGQMILGCKYFTDTKRKHITDYEWIANSLNPNNKINTIKYGVPLGDSYKLMKNNPSKWLWGIDNTGDITNVNNIKWFRNNIHKHIINNDTKTDTDTKKPTPTPMLNLIIGDGGLGTGNDTLALQKLDLAQVIMVLACSSIGGSCIIKHFTPYVSNHPETIKASSFFISLLYLYYVAFDEIILHKPYSSNMDSGEFYVIGKGFKGVPEHGINNLYKSLNKFKVNNAILDVEHIPETFKIQITAFIAKMCQYNIKGIDKTNLLLSCYLGIDLDLDKPEHLADAEQTEKSEKIEQSLQHTNIKKLNKTKNKMVCDKFLDANKIENILTPRYNAWIKLFKFE